MSTDVDGLELLSRDIGGWRIPTVGFADAERHLAVSVIGQIVNSVTERTDKLRDWKVQVTTEVKAARGGEVWSATDDYAVSLALSFHPANHGNRSLDAENFIKPIIDALAAGLFCDPGTDPRTIARWNYDDSNFNTLLIHRLPDPYDPEDEGVDIFVSSRRGSTAR